MEDCVAERYIVNSYLSAICVPHFSHPPRNIAPVNVVLENSPTKFHSSSVRDRSIFDMPPSPEVDAAWEALYSRS